jgi:hypothetical protein
MALHRTARTSGHTGRLIAAVGADSSYHLWIQYVDRGWTWVDLENYVLQFQPALLEVRTFIRSRVSPDGAGIVWPDGSRLLRSAFDGQAGKEIRPGIYVRQVATTSDGWYRPLVVRGLTEATGPRHLAQAQLCTALELTGAQLNALLSIYPVAAEVVSQRLLDLVQCLDNQRPSQPARSLLNDRWEAGERAGNPDLRTPLVAIARGRLALVEAVYTTRGRWV